MAKILYLGTAGSDDPTRAGFPFNFAMGALDAGHQPEVFLAGEAAASITGANYEIDGGWTAQ